MKDFIKAIVVIGIAVLITSGLCEVIDLLTCNSHGYFVTKGTEVL